jgi:hypothetical protein
MKLLVLLGVGVSLNIQYIKDTTKISDIVQNSNAIDDGVAIYDCNHTPDQEWADQVVKIGKCSSHDDIKADVIIDESADYEMELILLIQDLYSGEAESGMGENEF